MTLRYLLLWGLPILLLLGCDRTTELPSDSSHHTLIKNVQLLDLSKLGKGINDVRNAYVLIHGDEIATVGEWTDEVKIPQNCHIIDGHGKYLIPGLTDGFTAINNQAYCNAFLYMGVTSIISVDGGRRGPFFGRGNPSPDIYRLEGVGDEKISTAKMIQQIDSLYEAGFKVLLLMYGLMPDQLAIALQKAEEYDMATIGEMGFTTYKEGMDMGIDAFVHTTRYSLDIAPREMAKAVAEEPFSNDLDSPKWQYYKFLTQLKKDYEPLIEHAKNLGKSNTFIIPTSSLSYLDLPDHKNPWNETVASIIDIKDVNRPADPKTGNHSIDSVEQAAYTNLITNELSIIEPTYRQHGAKYLAASASDVWGTMPGISLHTELQLLTKKIGLTNREALAASTNNYAQAYGWKSGKIAPGFIANLLLLDANPIEDLENLRKINTLFLRGEIVDRAALLK